MSAFIGIGTGRCGTQSLTHIVNGCSNTFVTHEAHPSPWYTPGPNLGKLILSMKRSEVGLVGEVSCNLLPHVQQLRDPIPDLKVICLHRNKDDTVNSFLKWAFPSNMRPCDRTQRRERFGGTGVPDVVDRFPVIDAATPKQAWEFYWEMAEELMRQVEPPVFHMQMKSLNDDFSVRNMLKFLDIQDADVVLPHRRIWNSSKERIRV